MTNVNHVARFIETGKIEFVEESIPKAKSGEIVVKIKASGICGTDHHIYRGEVTGLVESGVSLGHEFAGEVFAIGKEVSGFTIGEGVAIQPNLFCGHCHYCRTGKKHFCENWSAVGLGQDGGFEEYVAVPASSAFKMPKGLSFEKAAFFEPMACVLHGIERSNLQPGETIIIQGAGSIGQLYVQAAKRLGASKIIVSDIFDEKLALAKKFGANFTVNPKNESLKDVVLKETNGIGAQVFIDAAGLINTIPSAIEMLENTGRIVIFGVPQEDQMVNISPFQIYRKEIQIIGSFTNPYTNVAALNMLVDIDVDPIITNPIKLSELVDGGLEKMGQEGVLKVQIKF